MKPDLLVTADRYGCAQVIAECEEALATSISDANLAGYRQLAQSHGLERLMVRTLVHSSGGEWTVAQMEAAKMLSRTFMERLLREYSFCGAVHVMSMLAA